MDFVIWMLLLAVSIVLHELSHGLAAYVLGDDTAKKAGRLSLNPLRHIDPVWTLALPLILYVSTGGRFVFAMAKPVPVNFNRLQAPKTDMALVGAAGPLANIILAFIFTAGWKWFGNEFLLLGVYLNLGLAIFNLVPLPPLDGSRVLAGFLPQSLAFRYLQMERLGYLILFALYFSGFLMRGMMPVLDFLCRFLRIPLFGTF